MATTKYERKRASILACAARLFNMHGVKGATLEDVASGVGLSLKSLRYYFKRKDQLVAACFMQSIDTYKELVNAAAGGATPDERIRRLLDAFFRTTIEVRRGIRPPFLHFGDIRALADIDTGPVGRAYLDMFRGIRALLISDGGELERAALNARAHMLLSQLTWAVVWVGHYHDDQLPRVANRMHEILRDGLATEGCHAAVHSPDAAVTVTPDAQPGPQDDFLKAATRLINERGYKGASIDKIAAQLNVTKGSFYHHNETKEELVIECFDRSCAIMREAQDNAQAQHTTGFDKLASATSALVTFQLSDDGPLLRTSALAAVAPQLRLHMTTRMDNISTRFSEMLSDGMIDGSVRPCDAAVAAQMITGMINAAAELGRWVRDVDTRSVTGLYVAPLLHGMCLDRTAETVQTASAATH